MMTLASMRPQPGGCGNNVTGDTSHKRTFSFNEAAAGRLRKWDLVRQNRPNLHRFNEAAAGRLRKSI